MREVAFKLEKGKEVPERLDGTEIRYTLPTTLAEIQEVCGGDESVVVSVFNEGFNLNHRQKIAKRFAAKENSTIESITAGMNAHKPAVRADRDPSAKRVTSQRKAVENDMLAELERTDPALAAKYRERLAAIAPKPKAKKAEGEGEAAPAAEGTAPAAAADPTTENQARRRNR